jgi:hypothetical protein
MGGSSSGNASECGFQQDKNMNDETAKSARLMKVIEAVVAELDRQGVAEALADLGFDPLQLAEVVIKAADGEVIPFPGGPRGH